MTSSDKLSSYDSMDQIIVHMNRDWGKGGEIVRETLYKKGILRALQDFKSFLPVSNSQRQRVLVPGAGLGRLAVEIAIAGFRWCHFPIDFFIPPT